MSESCHCLSLYGPSLAERVCRRLAALLLAFVVIGMTACSGGGGSASGASGPAPTPVAGNADITLFFMGNSHTDFHDVPGTVASLVRAARPGRTVLAEQAPGYLFLDERLNDAPTLNRLNSRRWSAVILQAQKYSSSGQFTYSTAEAEELVRIARRQGAQPVMFPEWPRQGVAETQRIFDLHLAIARAAPACVAPIGQAWDVAARRAPEIVLHAADGNHSTPAGAYLAAVVLAATLTGAVPTDFPAVSLPSVDAGTQQRLRAAAAEALQVHPPRSHCPGDPLLP
ncbi:MAG: hypothetical protein SF172_16120 [Burkholderiales bacterium]|nr:hypothetical protein [Burkholderiales bacterium]